MGRKEKEIPPEGNTLGSRLRQARQAAGLSLSQMDQLIDYTKSHISAVENDIGKPSQEFLAKYAHVINNKKWVIIILLLLNLEENQDENSHVNNNQLININTQKNNSFVIKLW